MRCSFQKFFILCGILFTIQVVVFICFFAPSRETKIQDKEAFARPAEFVSYRVGNKDFAVSRSTEGANEFFVLFVLILSSPNGRTRRDAIRQTWYEDGKKRKDVQLKFAIGIVGLTDAVLGDLQEEGKNHTDLLLLDNLEDSFTNLTRKVLYGFIWAAQNSKFSYLLKCDDDTFVVLDVVVNELMQRHSDRMLYWGFFDGRASVKRAGKYAESEWFLCDRYLPYALGGGYVLSGGLVRLVALNSEYLQLYKNEDVSVGAWLAPYDVERRHDVRFDTEYQSRGCNNLYIVAHKQSTQQMLEKRRSLKQTGKLCWQEVQHKPSYVYDWKKLPSQCCTRQVGIP